MFLTVFNRRNMLILEWDRAELSFPQVVELISKSTIDS